MWAVLIDRFKLKPWEIGKLTDRQISDLYFHARDEYGSIEVPGTLPKHIAEMAEQVPDEPDTLESELLAIDVLAGTWGLDRRQVEQAKEKMRARYGG